MTTDFKTMVRNAVQDENALRAALAESDIAPMLMVLVAILVAIPALGWFLVWQDQWDQIERERTTEAKLKEALEAFTKSFA